jgi:hypothetical protein
LDFVHGSAYKYLAESQRRSPEELPLILQPQEYKRIYWGILAVWCFTDCPDSLKDLQALREEGFRSRWYLTSEYYFEMHYGLLNAFRYISRGMARKWYMGVPQKILSMIRQLGDFPQSDKCITWVETATHINYSGDFPELLENVTSMLFMPFKREYEFDQLPSKELEVFRQRCQTFFHNRAYVIVQTTAWGETHTRNRRRRVCFKHDTDSDCEELLKAIPSFEKPPGFDENKIAKAMLQIGMALKPMFQKVSLRAPTYEKRHSADLILCFCGNVLTNETNGKNHAFRCGTTWSDPLRAKFHRRANPRDPEDLVDKCSGLA